MGLRAKIALLLIGVLIVLSTITVLVMRWDTQRTLDMLEVTESRGDLRRLLVSLDAQMLQVDTVLSSWSNWTSLYEHAGKPNATFVKNELNVESIRVAHIDWLLRIDPDGVVHDQVEVPQADGSLPVALALQTNKDRTAEFARSLAQTPAGCGTTQIEHRISLACYRPLHDGAGGGTARGTVIIGRWIGPAMIQSIKEQTDLNFDLVSVAQTAQSHARTAASIDARIGQGDPGVTRHGDHITISFPIHSLRKQKIGEIRMEWPRRSMANAQRTMAQTRNTLLLMLLGAAAVIIVLIDRIIVRRLRRLKNELGGVVADRDWNGSISSNGKDEIAELARYSEGLMGIVRTQLVELRELSAIDTLTKLPNRRTFDARLSHVLAQYARAKRPASLILIDIDHFKRYNDAYGHPAGDVALQRVAECLKSTLRRQLDLSARLGGEEFAVICDETTIDGAACCAELIRKALLDASIEHTDNPPLGIMSISCGVASIEDGDTATTLYQRADKALYHAKSLGRNCVSSSA